MHIPVLLKEVLEVLNPQPGEFFIDGTLGGGGHAKAIAKRVGPHGQVLAVEWDKEMFEQTKEALKNIHNIRCIQDNFKNLPEVLKQEGLPRANGLLLDLGFSSDHIEVLERGFSFKYDEPLFMTYSMENRPAYKWLDVLKMEELARILKEYGEERYAEPIARAIKKNLPITTTKKLREVIEQAVPHEYRQGRLHPATRTFQAIRILANEELENLQNIVDDIETIVAPEGRAAIISFHSLEDRLVKQAFRALEQAGKAVFITKKPLGASEEEIHNNPRSRSAKLRAIKLVNSQ